jgi:hypothetical protein
MLKLTADGLAVAGDRCRRVLVGPDLRPPGMDDVFVIGDTALAHDVAGEPLPGIAPVAKQQGAYVAEAIKARLTGKAEPKPGFNEHQEKGQSAFETITEQSFPGKWKIIYTYPKDFTFVCPTEIAGFAKLAKDFEDRDAVLLAGSTDNEFCKLGWWRDHNELSRLNHWQLPTPPACWSISSAFVRKPPAWHCARLSLSIRTT